MRHVVLSTQGSSTRGLSVDSGVRLRGHPSTYINSQVQDELSANSHAEKQSVPRPSLRVVVWANVDGADGGGPMRLRQLVQDARPVDPDVCGEAGHYAELLVQPVLVVPVLVECLGGILGPVSSVSARDSVQPGLAVARGRTEMLRTWPLMPSRRRMRIDVSNMKKQ
ncbi:hypothetical protein G6O67_005197 [Ophiocordyceps sinensis]|uniref:Uncharacterized protein n=1 Tax=Ophiocordyceps sinensis TaxID=72228 RepID=A0A8H4PR75_9HYPO|nr:hypothetical protein G6O67_005197 [Ophiocordyceps sinensis]